MHTRFLLNTRPLTMDPDFCEGARAGGYLFPPDPPKPALAQAVARSRRFVLADNGAFNDIGRLAAAAPTPTSETGWADLQRNLREAAAGEGHQVEALVQLAAAPDAVIGPEDITLAVWLRAGVPEKLLRSRRRELKARNRAVAVRGTRMGAQLPGLGVLTVASAHDYDSAYDAGEVFASAGIHQVAMGFGAFMADDSWTDELKIRGRIRRLDRRLPNRYLRTALVARGFFDGYTSSAARISHFHFLGLGAPIMVPLVCLAASGAARVTFDATSPIKDAVTGSLYTSKPAPLTVRSWNVAQRLATGDLANWRCPCRFCTAFMGAHPFDLPTLRDTAADRRLSASDLKIGTPVGDALPLFSIGRSPLGVEAENARIGHNHWVLGTLTRAVQSAPDLQAFIARRVEQYVQHAGAAHFGQAVRTSFQIVAPTSDFWS